MRWNLINETLFFSIEEEKKAEKEKSKEKSKKIPSMQGKQRVKKAPGSQKAHFFIKTNDRQTL